jgi:hypothetical protein
MTSLSWASSIQRRLRKTGQTAMPAAIKRGYVINHMQREFKRTPTTMHAVLLDVIERLRSRGLSELDAGSRKWSNFFGLRRMRISAFKDIGGAALESPATWRHSSPSLRKRRRSITS